MTLISKNDTKMKRTLKGRLVEILYEYGHIVKDEVNGDIGSEQAEIKKEVIINKILTLIETK
tara:strand:- start:688 stop:873 length:186 start_codon:yes stop_codon:yes gene_type:complete